MKNPRMTVTFTEPQIDYLKKEAERLGITVGEAVRRIIDSNRGATPTELYLDTADGLPEGGG